ncbi:MAG TPA: hypothetical protein VNT50_06705 [Microbacterium sp.]|uniref:hypothetical protein n=1 Tax=Microbacterium sp. TaxID=51671 RepID=UPI002C1D24A5|nr:hypothetical protein [Microbacterium sp.]HWI31161.1 hypothetical protein [Microbacterium sp.]
MSRTLNVVRMQLINRQTFVWVPLLILSGSFVLSLLIFSLIPTNAPKYSGAAQSTYWYFLALGVMAMAYTFPFSQAMSVTRRAFYLGTLLTAAAASGVLATIFIIGGFLEQATNGWGFNGSYFYIEPLWANGWWGAWFVWFVIGVLFFVIGFWSATLYKRFGTFWLTAILIAIGALFVGLIWLIGTLQAWDEVFAWFGAQGVLGLSAWGLLLTAVLAGISYLTLRRTTP